MISHRMVCRGSGCDCCPTCGDHRYAAKDGRCLTCFPPGRDAPAVKPKTRTRSAGAPTRRKAKPDTGQLTLGS